MLLEENLQHSHLADELTAEGVDDTCYGGGFSLADEIKVEHTLDSSRLHTAGECVSWFDLFFLEGRRCEAGQNLLDKTSRLRVVESVDWFGAQRSTGSSKTLNIVVGGVIRILRIHSTIGGGSGGAIGHGGGSHDFLIELLQLRLWGTKSSGGRGGGEQLHSIR